MIFLNQRFLPEPALSAAEGVEMTATMNCDTVSQAGIQVCQILTKTLDTGLNLSAAANRCDDFVRDYQLLTLFSGLDYDFEVSGRRL